MMNLSASEHLKRCLAEENDYSVGKAHCRLASLYPDFDSLLSDVILWKHYQKLHLLLYKLGAAK